MKKFFPGFVLFALFVVGFVSAPAWSDEYVEGTHYEKLDNQQPTGDPTKVEVLEAFWYGCPHCFQLEPTIAEWLETKPEDVAFIRFPAIPTPRWEWYAKAFYVAEVLGLSEKIHSPLFKSIHDKNKQLRSPEEMAAFFAGFGVEKQDFLAALDSFAVVTKINQARQLTRRFGLSSVPTIIINGKYRTSGRMAGTSEDIFKVVNFLIEKERPMIQSAAKGNP